MALSHQLYLQIDAVLKEAKDLDEKYANKFELTESEIEDRCSIVFECERKVTELFQQIQRARVNSHVKVMESQFTNEITSVTPSDGRSSKDLGLFVMITVNPEPTVTHQQLFSTVQRFLSRKFVKWAIYNIEQRSDVQGTYHGFHCHILFERQRRPTDVFKAVKDTFVSICPKVGPTGMPVSVKIKSRHSADEVVNYVHYMLGQKKDKAKKPKALNDVNMRKDFGYQPIYTLGHALPTCLSACLPPCLNGSV